jgi:hypothetical protein
VRCGKVIGEAAAEAIVLQKRFMSRAPCRSRRSDVAEELHGTTGNCTEMSLAVPWWAGLSLGLSCEPADS